MALELKIISPSEEGFVKQIIWNADEISAEVANRVSYYKNLVYTDDQIIEAKKDRASLNKFIAALKAKDREIKALCLQPYEEFHAKMVKIIAQVEEPAALIDKQVKEYEDAQKAQKLEAVKDLFNACEFPHWVKLDRIMNPSWLNKSYSIKRVQDDLSRIQQSISDDILLINQMGEGQPAALMEYQRTLDKAAAVEAGKKFVEAKYAEQRLVETVMKQQEEAAKQKQAEIDRDLGISQPVLEPMANCEPIQKEPAAAPIEQKQIGFVAWLTREQFEALNQCLKLNRIKVYQLRKGGDGKWQ